LIIFEPAVFGDDWGYVVATARVTTPVRTPLRTYNSWSLLMIFSQTTYD
jgi:hypothetical protein